MCYRGRVQNGVIVLEQAGAIPDGTPVNVEPIADKSAATVDETAADVMMEFAGIIDDLPTDMARNLDHYLQGHPKR